MTSSIASPCIHGFETGQCAACRICPHGLAASRCGRCTTEAAKATRRRTVLDGPQPPNEERQGWEILYVPELSGWQIRRPDGAPAPDSYRSLFLARKAVDQMIENPPPAARPSKRRK